MFPAASSHSHPGASAGVYRRIGVETGVAAAAPHQLVTMLFDGFNDAVAQARGALQDGHVETKCKAITRAVRIVDEGLKAALDVDAGGPLAQNLGALYAYVALRLTEANLNNDTLALDECVRLMEPVRTAWVAIGPGATATTAAQ
ncbi:MAG: flagellar export chaperone FliS [Caldimonas sp.]